MTDKISMAVEVRMNIRTEKILNYKELVKILKNEIPLDLEKHKNYLYGFFEECYPKLIKNFIEIHNISREKVIDLFNQLPERGEKYKFKEALENGKF